MTTIKEIIAAERWDHRERGLISTKWHHASLDRIEAAVSECIKDEWNDGYLKGCNRKQESYEQRIAELEAQVARLTGEIEYGCHCDVFDDEEPDECVIPSGRINDCHYARTRKYTAPEQCPEWRPIKKARGDA